MHPHNPAGQAGLLIALRYPLQAREEKRARLEATLAARDNQKRQYQNKSKEFKKKCTRWQANVDSANKQLQDATADASATADLLAKQNQAHEGRQESINELQSQIAAREVTVHEAQQTSQQLKAMQAEHIQKQQQIVELQTAAKKGALHFKSLQRDNEDMQLRLTESEKAVQRRVVLEEQVEAAEQRVASLVSIPAQSQQLSFILKVFR